MGKVDQSLLSLAHANDIRDVEGVCGGECGCATCHIMLPEDVYAVHPEPSDDEQDMLDMLELEGFITPTSRLGCQFKLEAKHTGMRVTVPKQMRGF